MKSKTSFTNAAHGKRWKDSLKKWAQSPSGPGSTSESLVHLSYRYLWPFQYFRDVTIGDPLERSQNYRHNRARRGYLPGFIVKWITLTTIWIAAGYFFDLWGMAVLASTCFIGGSATLIVVVVLGVVWLWLERFPELF